MGRMAVKGEQKHPGSAAPLEVRQVVASFAGLNRQAEAQGTACGRRAGSGSLVIFAGNHLKRGLEVL